MQGEIARAAILFVLIATAAIVLAEPHLPNRESIPDWVTRLHNEQARRVADSIFKKN